MEFNVKNPQAESNSDLELTILMPCLNEAETIGICIAKAQEFLQRAGVKGEVLIADNGSTDGSRAIATNLGARVIPIPQRGYGAALGGGIEAACGRYIVMGDADDSYDFANLDAFLSRLRAGADLVMGNRFRGGIESNAMPFLHRYLGNPVLSFLGRLFFEVPVGDFHCGLRGFRADAIRGLNLETTGMEFASEMVVKSALARLQIAEVPTTLRPDGRSRPPHLRTWPDGWRHFKFLLMYSPRWLFMTPGAVLTALGALLASLLFFGPVHFGANVILDLNTFISACFLVVVGTQVMTVGAVSQYYATVTGLLPKSRRSEFLLNHVSTDRMVLLSAVFLLIGIGLFGYAVHGWAEQNFGPLTSPFIPRMVVAGMSVVVIGLQTFFTAFLLGVLNIPLPAVSGMTVMRRNGSVRSALRVRVFKPARCGRVGNQVSDRGVVKRHGIPGGRFDRNCR